MKTKNKEQLRQEAIGWQGEFARTSMSYSEILRKQAYFRKEGKKCGLLKEFKENGII